MQKVALGVHGFIAGWILINGVAHIVGVLWKARAGTLSPHLELGSLMWVGAGLLAAGTLLAVSWPALARGSYLLPFGGVLVLGAVIAAIAHGYGFAFLGGSMVLFGLDLAVLLTHAQISSR